MCVDERIQIEESLRHALRHVPAPDGFTDRVVSRIGAAQIRVSLFIEPAIAAVEAAARLQAPVVELHTGAWCLRVETGDLPGATAEFERIAAAAERATALGLECHAGHGLDYATAQTITRLADIRELNIGHFLIGDAITVGLPAAVARMRAAMAAGRAGIAA